MSLPKGNDMAMTPQDQSNDEQEFGAAFNEPDAVKPEQSEDEAFGLNQPEDGPEEGEGPQGEPAAESVTGGVADSPEVAEPGESQAQESAETPAAEAQEQAQGTEDDGPTDPKDIQRQKSWEGRLKAREAELKAREDALKGGDSPAAAEAGETPSEEAAESPELETAEQVVQAAQDGTLTAEQAKHALTQDFGDDFVKMITTIIQAQAGEAATKTTGDKVGKVDETVNALISEIKADKVRAHFEAIQDAHPDFMDFAEGPAMDHYLAGLSDADRASAQKVIDNGSAKQIVKLLTAVKSSVAAPAEPEADASTSAAMDAAEGVRSKGVKIPEKPGMAQDYENAWNEF